MSTKNFFRALALVFASLIIIPDSSDAQLFKRKKKNENLKDEILSLKSDFKSISEITESAEMLEGLFTVYRDTLSGESWMVLSESALDSEFIYFSQVEDGVLQTGNFRGSYRGSKVISFERHFDRIEVRSENTSYYFNPESPLTKTEHANINTPILASLKIAAKDLGNDTTEALYLISSDAIFLSEKVTMIKPPSRPGSKSPLGKLSQDKTKITDFNNYPENLEVVVDYVYDNPNATTGGTAITDARYITVSYRHAILEMPAEGFTPRRDDARIGFFMTEVNDMTSTSSTPWNDMIHRWRLVKKNPDAKLSEPVKPITWWIENSTPYEFRDYIKTGVEKWNLAFEQIGFKNAIVVKIQPDDATWEAGDIRYNVLRWTSSPSVPFSGYGPSFVNPRTGEILGADVMLEFAGMAGRLWKSSVFTDTQEETDDISTRARTAELMNRCDVGSSMAHNALFSISAMKVLDLDAEEHAEFVRQTLHRLSLHEVGHTLGLSHNMHASTMLSPDELKDPDVVAVNGMCNSVMEYPAINFARNPEDQTLYYDDSPGPYDYWVIEYGYSEGLKDPELEAVRLESILSKSNSELLQFGNDADDMRSTGRGINPDVNIYDLSNDPVSYASERCELVNDLYFGLVDKYATEGKSFNDLNRAYMTLRNEYAIQLRVMTRQIAGIRYNRSGPDNIGSEMPFTPVSEADQKAALAALTKYAFDAHAFDAAESTYAYLQQQRRGFGFYSYSEDPKIHSHVLSSQMSAIVHLTHPNVLQRISDTRLYGNDYDVASYISDLTDAVFKYDLNKSVNTFRQNLQIAYVELLLKADDSKSRYDRVSKGVIIHELKAIYKSQWDARSPNALTRAHRDHIIHLIDQAWKQ
jgi:hypothetical protein